MRHMKKQIGVVLSAFLALYGLVGCSAGATRGATGGSTGSTTTAALEIADQMSLVTAEESGVSSSLSRLVTKMAVPTSGDYLTDEVNIYVFDESMDVLELINEILCQVEQTHYYDLVNQGDYIALNDLDLCSQNKDRSNEGSDQSSSEEEGFETWIVNSSRESDSSPEVVKFWIQTEAGGDDPFDQIQAKLTITEGKSETNPFGVFSMDFVGLAEGAEVMSGNLSSVETTDGKVEFEMSIDGGEFFKEQTHAIIEPDGSAGQAFVYQKESFGENTFEETVQVAFNEDHYLAQSASDLRCLDRKNFSENVWEYNLYDAAGSRVERNSGMSIRSGEAYGWAGYHGIWLPEELGAVTNGMEVTSEDGDATYTVFQGGGRLIRRTRHEMTMGDLLGDTFSYFDNQNQQNYYVQWDGTNLVKTGINQCGENGCQFTDTPDEAITLIAHDFIGLWKDGFGNIDIVVPDDGKLTNLIKVPYFVEEFVTPSDSEFASGSLQLKCYSQCLRSPLTESIINSGMVTLDDIQDNTTTPYAYTISASDMTLKKDGQSITMSDGVEIDQASPNFWGVRSGPMILSTKSLANFWESWQQDISYMYETGPNSWNKYTTLLDSTGKAVEFEKPLDCLYQSDDNGTYILDYNGPGQLHGIPFDKVESEDEESTFERWVAQFVIPDGSELSCDSSSYYTKAMSIEQNMITVDEGDCSDLALGDVGAPENSVTDPEIGDAPDVTEAPKVIGGVVQ